MDQIIGFSKISEKGQVTIPKEVREILSVPYGSKISFIRKDNGNVEIGTVNPTSKLSQLLNLISFLSNHHNLVKVTGAIGAGKTAFISEYVMSTAKNKKVLVLDSRNELRNFISFILKRDNVEDKNIPFELKMVTSTQSVNSLLSLPELGTDFDMVVVTGDYIQDCKSGKVDFRVEELVDAFSVPVIAECFHSSDFVTDNVSDFVEVELNNIGRGLMGQADRTTVKHWQKKVGHWNPLILWGN